MKKEFLEKLVTQYLFEEIHLDEFKNQFCSINFNEKINSENYNRIIELINNSNIKEKYLKYWILDTLKEFDFKIIENDPVLGRVEYSKLSSWEGNFFLNEENTSVNIEIKNDTAVFERINDLFRSRIIDLKNNFSNIEPKILKGLFDYYKEIGQENSIENFEHMLFMYKSAGKSGEKYLDNYLEERGFPEEFAPSIDSYKEIKNLIELSTIFIDGDWKQENRIVLAYSCDWEDYELIAVELINWEVKDITNFIYYF